MKFFKTHIILLLFCALALLCSTKSYGQKGNCLIGCTNVIPGGGIIKLKLTLDPELGTISFEKNKYKIKLKPSKKLIKAKLLIEDIPDNVKINFSNQWNPEPGFIVIKSICASKIKDNANKTLSIWFNSNIDKIPINSELKYKITKLDGTCVDAVAQHSLYFAFIDGNEKPVAEPIQAPIDTTVNKPKEKIDTSSDLNKSELKEEIDLVQETSENNNNEKIIKNTTPIINIAEGKSEEEKAYEKILSLGTLKAFVDFKNKYPSHRSKEVKRAIALRKKIDNTEFPNETDTSYVIQLKNVFAVVLDSLGSRGVEGRIIDRNETNHTAKLILKKPKGENNLTYTLIDPEKPDSVNRSFPRTLGNHMSEPKFIYDEDSTLLGFQFKRGTPPYMVYFVKDDIILGSEETNESRLLLSDKMIEKYELRGEVFLKFSDKNRSTLFSRPDWKINIPEKSTFTQYWLGGLVLLLLGLVFIYPKILASQRKRNRQKYMEERYSDWDAHFQKIKSQKVMDSKEPKEIIEEGGNEYKEEKKKEASNQGAKKTGIKIKGVKRAAARFKKHFDEKVLDKFLKTEISFEFDTTLFWNDTMISSIFFTQKGIEKLDHFLKDQNLTPLREQEGQIPEIGGILLGKPFFSDENKNYRVLVEEFVPIDPEYHDRYQLEFSAQSMARDLGNIQDQFPELLLVGWFHTHPGHGLFLSKPDLRIHDSFFTEPYQFAMEIDSLSTRLDTGFFTRMKNGKVNNRKNLLSHSQWYSWLEAEINN